MNQYLSRMDFKKYLKKESLNSKLQTIIEDFFIIFIDNATTKRKKRFEENAHFLSNWFWELDS